MKVFTPLIATSAVLAASKFDLDTVLDSLNEINEWASIRRTETLDENDLPGQIDEFQAVFLNAAKNGATRKEVKELEHIGRRVLLDDMVISNSDGFDMAKLSGYGCYGTPIDRKNKNWVGKGKPIDAVDEVNFRLLNCYK